jgi:hypothetical protein
MTCSLTADDYSIFHKVNQEYQGDGIQPLLLLMKTICNTISSAGLLLVLFFPSTVRAQNFAAVHWGQ